MAEFNQLTKGLPKLFTIEPISVAPFVLPSHVRSCDEVEAEQNALWALEFLQIQSSISLMAKDLDGWDIWSESKLVAIDYRLRLLRVTEEVGLVIWETDPGWLWRWMATRVTAFNDFISDFQFIKEILHHAKEFV